MSLPHDPPPRELVTNGAYNFGTFSAPIPTLNPLDATRRQPRWLRNLRLKEWEAFQFGNDDWFVCGAVYSAKALGVLQIAVVHWPTGKIIRWIERLPAWKLQVARGLDDTISTGRGKRLEVSVENHLPQEGVIVRASHDGTDELPPMSLELSGHGSADNAAHLVICHPFSPTKALYSNKSVMGAEGQMSIGTEEIRFERERSFLILDDHKGDYPFPMKYDWITGARINTDGRRIGFNLTDNQVMDPETFNENAVFIDNKLWRLGAVTFSRPHGVNQTWTVRDASGDVDVQFHPDIASELHVGPRRCIAEYFGPYGRFEGTIRTPDEVIELDGFRGMGEKKLIRS